MPLFYPPPETSVDPARVLVVTLQRGSELVRVYDAQSRYKPGPRTFRFNGPRLRFDHHRRADGAPADDPDRGIYYAAYSLEGAIVEVFGDPPRLIERGTFRVVRARLRDPIQALDLRQHGAMLAGTSAGISGTESRLLTQAWARWFYENPAIYGNIGGLLYSNSHNAMDAIALFERAEPAVVGSVVSVVRLSNPRLEPGLLRIAGRNGLTLI